MICTIYAHTIGFDKIKNTLQNSYPKGILTLSKQGESDIAELEIKGGIFSASKKIKVMYRQRAQPSYQIPQIDDSPLTANLKGLYSFITSLPAKNETVRDLFLRKILTINCEFSIQQEGETKELKTFIQTLAKEFDAVVFAQPDTVISRSGGQHFLDKNLNLIIDTQGNCEIDNLTVEIDSVYFDGEQNTLSEDQTQRKLKSEKLLQQHKIKVNNNLPCIGSENETNLRSPKQIATRVSILAITNMVAFNNIPAGEAIAYIKKHNLWDHVTTDEKDFLENPTDEKKNNETWKCECIWTLMWALNKVDDLGFPDQLCHLDNINPDNYPIGESKDPNNFINSATTGRSKAEILDANDFYYRLDWACVNARIKNEPMDEALPGVVYERHYALNWLINYQDQDWDSVSCDT